MAPRAWPNPFAFRPGPVTFFCSALYLALLIPLIHVHVTVPAAPAQPPYAGVNLTEAWQDLQFLTDGFHPYNSRRNDVIHDWLLYRLGEILADSGASIVDTQKSEQSWSSPNANVTVFNDKLTNLSLARPKYDGTVTGTYFEGTNIFAYIRGAKDEPGPWWERRHLDDPSGVLINAHYDSVSTGFGATDDGMGVVSLLQLVKHFVTEGNQPRHGIVILFNNGEEDYLNGARAYGMHPVSRFTTVVLNLEGAGAGGRAALFRTTDTEVTRAYQGTEHPFGNVLISDGFKRGLVRSDTDYSVFHGEMNMRGVDIAFVEPRALYHTVMDDARHASVDSLWHMLSAALHTAHRLSETTWKKDSGTDGVWFDLLGDSFVDMELHTLFALSVTFLVVGPIAAIATCSALSGSDKLYMFKFSNSHSGQLVPLHGFHGLFRTPIIIGVPSIIVIGLAFLIVKVNPFIVGSSPYAVWSMMLSIWIFVAWFIAKTAEFARPTALHRLYSFFWLSIIFWVLLVIVAIFEDNFQIASGYPIVWVYFAYAVALLVGIVEFWALDTREDFAAKQIEDSGSSTRRRESAISKIRRTSAAGSGPPTRARGEDTAEEAIEEEPTESTSLLGSRPRTTFANYAASIPESLEEIKAWQPYQFEQEWSGKLPSWTWLLQLMVATPLTVILVGQMGLGMTVGLNQTLADGSSPLIVYVFIAICAIFILLPLTPFLHRFTYHIPTFLAFIFVGTLIYNLVAFPFSAVNPFKVYFIQEVNLDTGINYVSLVSTENPHVLEIIRSLPSSTGQEIRTKDSAKQDLIHHYWVGTPPQVVPPIAPSVPPELGYAHWLSFNVTRTAINKASFSVRGRNTRSCRLYFDKPVVDFRVDGDAIDPRFPLVTDNGIQQVRLWSREWENTWNVTVTWNADAGEGQDGRVACLWNSDQPGTIPALEEVWRFAPSWSVVTKYDDGLVEGYKTFFV